jgi:hypothetical protein
MIWRKGGNFIDLLQLWVLSRYTAIFYMQEAQGLEEGLPESLKEESDRNTIHEVSEGLLRLPVIASS